MANDTETAEASAERLEAALERIARLAVVPSAGPGEHAASSVPVAEIRARLDATIARLRAALESTD